MDLNKKLWRIPQRGHGAVASAPGIASYLDVPVKLVRILVAVLAMILRPLALLYPGGLHHFDFCSGSDAGQRELYGQQGCRAMANLLAAVDARTGLR